MTAELLYLSLTVRAACEWRKHLSTTVTSSQVNLTSQLPLSTLQLHTGKETAKCPLTLSTCLPQHLLRDLRECLRLKSCLHTCLCQWPCTRHRDNLKTFIVALRFLHSSTPFISTNKSFYIDWSVLIDQPKHHGIPSASLVRAQMAFFIFPGMRATLSTNF